MHKTINGIHVYVLYTCICSHGIHVYVLTVVWAGLEWTGYLAKDRAHWNPMTVVDTKITANTNTLSLLACMYILKNNSILILAPLATKPTTINTVGLMLQILVYIYYLDSLDRRTHR